MKIRKMKSVSEIAFSVGGKAILPGDVFEIEDNISARELLGNGKAVEIISEESTDIIDEEVADKKSKSKK